MVGCSLQFIHHCFPNYSMISLTQIVINPKTHSSFVHQCCQVPNVFGCCWFGNDSGQVSAESESAEDIGHDATVDEEDEEEEEEVLVEEDQIIHQVGFLFGSNRNPSKCYRYLFFKHRPLGIIMCLLPNRFYCYIVKVHFKYL